ncbi:MAG: extracellular solute-binding protein, partial [Leptotrichiaceae bacterium]|nr:extracellular solute-binding protein [Leptotrichiaceae bacterium]
MKTKLFVLSLISMMFLMACGEKKEAEKKENSDSKETVLKFSALESGYGDKMWPEIVEEYQKLNPNVKIELTQSKDIESSLPGQFQAENFPDVIMLAVGRKAGITDNFVKEKELTDLSPVMDMKVPGEEKTVKEKLVEGFTGNTTTNPYSDGKVYL